MKSRRMTPMQLLQHAQFHGANRLADKSSRWFWLPALLILLALAVILVILAISRYESVPTHMVQIESVHAIKKFPSVILCPPVRFIDEKMDKFVSEIKYPAGMNASVIRAILPQFAAFFSLDVPYTYEDLNKLEVLLEFNGLDMEMVGEQLTATCEESIIRCRWSRTTKNCSELFQMYLTGDGFCCVFNGRSLRNELEEQNRNNIPVSEYNQDYYTRRFGFSSGLMLAVEQNQKPLNVDLSYKWIALQPSQHFVETTLNGTALSPASEHWIAYFTRTFSIADGAQSLSKHLRKCKMSFEKLTYFPSYGKKYCLLENEMANTLKLCNCVRMVHPRPIGTTRCSARMLPCAIRAMVPYDSVEFDCPSTCDVDKDFWHASSFSLTDSVVPVDPFYHGLELKNVTVVRVFIQNRRQMAKQRWAYFSSFDLFSQLGGMFGIFFGCSVLTLLALIQIAWRALKMKLSMIYKEIKNVKKAK